MSAHQADQSTLRPLIVDLDFSLLATDVTYETILLVLKQRPWALFALPLWYRHGKVAMKQRLAAIATPDVSSVPIHDEVLAFVREEHARGRRCVLATASLRSIAQPLCDRLGVFDDCLATDSQENIGGEAKVKAIRELIGNQEFDYVGDRSADLPVWKAAHDAIAVNPASGLERTLGRPFARVFYTRGSGVAAYLRCLRMHQWLKNLLIFLPLLLAHKIFDLQKILSGIEAFAAFSLCASAVYIVNDLLDIESDRRHPRKKLRPFASGQVPVHHGLMMVPILLIASAALALSVGLGFTLALACYALITSAYSFSLKRVVIVDVLILAGLYVYRILCGAIAADVAISPWMLAFSMFMFLSLAIVKRYSELLVMKSELRSELSGRGYSVHDSDILRSVGTAAGYMSVLVMALYINSTDVVKLYAHPMRLWLLEPLLLYWITRIWFIAHRGEMHDDPVVFAMEDRVSYLIALMSLVIVAVSTVSTSILP